MAEVVAMRRDEQQDGPVRAAFADGILRLTLSNPPANALSLATIAAMRSELDAAREDKAVRVVIIAAAGKVFCAGHDLTELTAHRADAAPQASISLAAHGRGDGWGAAVGYDSSRREGLKSDPHDSARAKICFAPLARR